MKVGCYRLLAQRSVGSDGVAYHAQSEGDGDAVEVRQLGNARGKPERWHVLRRQLRLAALFEHSASLRILEQNPEHDPPFIVVERLTAPSLAEALRSELPLNMTQAAVIAQELASVLAAAHRLGLTHGRLAPNRFFLTPLRKLCLDLTGCEVETTPTPTSNLEKSCRAPECSNGPASAAADVFSLGAILYWMLTGQPIRASSGAPSGQAPTIAIFSDLQTHQPEPLELERLIRAMVSADPSERPTARDVDERLSSLLGTAGTPNTLAATGVYKSAELLPSAADGPAQLAVTPAQQDLTLDCLGRFHLREKLGQGGMGAVYRAEDPADGSQVAIKVLRSEVASRPEALRRFLKEARMLAEVNSPYVTNLLEVNEDAGVHYLALEYVAGRNLGQLLQERGRLDERPALQLLADVARGLAVAHERGIVHRDIKPENILLVAEPAAGDVGLPRVKLSDFGLARHIVETESLNVTQAGAVLGTPLYMAPEQCSGRGQICPATDVYAMGATLFHMMAGRPPFVAATPLALITMHNVEPAPPLQRFQPAASSAVCHLIDRALAKSAAARYADAGALLLDIERILRGEPTAIAVHPCLPPCNPANVLEYDWSWDLDSSPEQLWPHVSNTERLNRAIGLSAVEFTNQADEAKAGPAQKPKLRRFGRFRKAGITAAWEEHPFEWVEARRMGVLREYSQGPFKWLVSIVDLKGRTNGGTTLSHRIRIEPRGLFGRTVAAIEVGARSQRSLERVYRRIDAAVTGKLGSPWLADPFEEPAALSTTQHRRLDTLLDQLVERGIDPSVAERFGDFLAQAPAQEIARIRPLALARRLSLDPEQVVAACLHGANLGLLVLHWDILCPVCRIPTEVVETLKQLREHGRCEACNLDYELDFANSVEMIFRANPEVRSSELLTYCIGGPAHSPHVVAQVRVAPNERIELDLALTEGEYRLRGPQLPFVLDFQVRPTALATRWDIVLSRGLDTDLSRHFKAGRQVLALTNDFVQEILVRVERTAPRADALTAARASALALFRELFPGEILTAGQLVSVANITLLVTDLEHADRLYQELGDTRAFACIHEFFQLLSDRARREGGALIKTVGEAGVATFTEPVNAVRVALDLPALLASHDSTRQLQPRSGVHRGPALAATLNDHLDYFGTTVNLAHQLPKLIGGGELVFTQSVATDPQTDALLRSRGFTADVIPSSATELGSAGPLLRVVVKTGDAGIR